MGAAGYAGVWATENTREALVEAFKRKEVYCTTGPRIKLRFFGGFGFTDADTQGDMVKAGYSKGVPMGGDLKNTDGKAPSFLVAVMKDSDGANMDRIQIVKGWLDEDGKTHEKVYDVAAGKRLPVRLPEWTRAIPPYAIGSLAMYWVLDRSWDYTLGLLLR